MLKEFLLFALKIICWCIGHIPLGLSLWLGRVLGRLGFYLDKKHRHIVLTNLRASFKNEKTDEEILLITRKVFENLGMNLMEFFRIPYLTKGDLQGYVECEGVENFKNAYDAGKGVIFITGHIGNWELMAAFYGLNGYPVDVVVRDLDSPLMDAFVCWVRTRPGNRIVSKEKSMRDLIRRLSENAVVGILIDQNVTWSEGVFVYYFDRLACTNKGPALLSMATDAKVIPTFIVRQGKGHKIIVGQEVPVKKAGDRSKDQLDNTAAFTKVIEDFVRQYPDQWFWLHQRWKSQPENDPNRGTEKAAPIQVKNK